MPPDLTRPEPTGTDPATPPREPHRTRRSPVAALVTGAVLLVVLASLGIGVLAGAGGDADEATASDRAVGSGKVSDEAFVQVPLEATKEAVLAALRPAVPIDAQSLERYDEPSPDALSSSCVYYDSEGIRRGALYRFCFTDDVLVDKTVVLPREET